VRLTRTRQNPVSGRPNEHRIVHTSGPCAKGTRIGGTYFAETAQMKFRVETPTLVLRRVRDVLRKRPSVCLPILLLGLLPFLAGADQQRDADKDTIAIIQASYIYNIAKLVEWHDPGARTGPFIIGILGSDNLYQELVKKYSMRSIGKQPIEVRKLPLSAEVDRCHILFLPKEERSLLPTLLHREQTRSTLIISDYPQALSEGAVINFVSASNTLKYEISIVNAKKHDLDIGLTLKQLADRVVE